MPAGDTSPPDPLGLLDALPGAVFVLDAGGIVTFASTQAAALLGLPVRSLVGRSVLDFVSEDTAWSYAAAVAMAADYQDVRTGPLRVRFRDAEGAMHQADLWAQSRLDDPAIAGIVCLVTEETTAMALSEAIDLLVAGAAPDDVASQVVAALAGHPVVTDGLVLVPRDGGFAPLGRSPVPAAVVEASSELRLHGALVHGSRRVHDRLDNLPADVREVAEAAGYAALWVEPAPSRPIEPADAAPPADALLLMWRRRSGPPSPNQLSSIHQAASVLALVLERTRVDHET